MLRLTLSLLCCGVLFGLRPLSAQITHVIDVPPDTAPSSISAGTRLNLSDGGVISHPIFTTYADSELLVSGGVTEHVRARDGSFVDMSGGMIGSLSVIGATVQLSGGLFGDSVDVYSGATLALWGGEYFVDGLPIAGLDSPGDSLTWDDRLDGTLSGVLADGTPFIFARADGDDIDPGTTTLHVVDLPEVETGEVVVSAGVTPQSLRDGQVLTIAGEGRAPDQFRASRGSTLNVQEGGEVGKNFEMFGGTVAIEGGSIGEHFDAHAGSVVTLRSGEIGRSAFVAGGSVLNVHGGVVGRYLYVTNDGQFNMYGGLVHEDFIVSEGRANILGGAIAANSGVGSEGELQILGGVIGDRFTIAAEGKATLSGGGVVGNDLLVEAGGLAEISGGAVGDRVTAEAGSSVVLSAVEFLLDGVPVVGLMDEGDAIEFDLPQGVLLSGVYANGVPFAFASYEGDEFASGVLTLRQSQPLAPRPDFLVASRDPTPPGIHDGQTLVVDDGAAVGDHFNAGRGSTLLVEAGGVVGDNLEAAGASLAVAGMIGDHFDLLLGSQVELTEGRLGEYGSARHGSVITVTGGSIGSGLELVGSEIHLVEGIINGVVASEDSHITIDGGSVFYLRLESGRVDVHGGKTTRLRVEGGAEATITGGSINDLVAEAGSLVNVGGAAEIATLTPETASVVNISGGSISRQLFAPAGSQINLSGGILEAAVQTAGDLVASGGKMTAGLTVAAGGSATFSGGVLPRYPTVLEGGQAELLGGDFFLDNVPLPIETHDGTMQLDIETGSYLTGVLADGTPFILRGSQMAPGAFTLVDATIPPVVAASWVLPVDPTPEFLGPQQSLRVLAGGVVPDSFMAGRGSAIVVEQGGKVGERLSVVDTLLQIRGGEVGKYAAAYDGSRVEITGGKVEDGLEVFRSELLVSGGSAVGVALRDGSVAQMNGGSLEGLYVDNGVASVADGVLGRISIAGAGRLTMSGGRVEDELTVLADGTARVSGGFVNSFEATGDLEITGGIFGRGNFSRSSLSVSGAEFFLDETPIQGLSTVGDVVEVEVADLAVLSGTLSDGSPFAYSRSRADAASTIKLVRADVPPIEQSTFLASTGDFPPAIRDGQRLTVDDGAEVGEHFRVGRGAELVIQNGGFVGGFLDSVGGTVSVEGGQIGRNFLAMSGTHVVHRGGRIGYLFDAYPGSIVELRGGTMGDHLHSIQGSQFEIYGGEFHLNGSPIAGLVEEGDVAAIDLPRDWILTGVLSDGVPFAFSSYDHDSFHDGVLTLHRTIVPPAAPSLFVASAGNVPPGLRSNQTLLVDAGGVVPDDLTASAGSVIEVEAGGVIGENLELVGADVAVRGGTIGPRLDLFDGAVLTLHDGSIGSYATVASNSRLNIRGGEVGWNLEVSQSVVEMTGGVIYEVEFDEGGVLEMSGGQLAEWVIAKQGSELHFTGLDFSIDGEPLTGLQIDVQRVIDARRGLLRGRLTDGSFLEMNLYGYLGFRSDISPDALLTVTLGPGTADFNGDLLQDGRDLLIWQASLGLNAQGDADGDGQTRGLDLLAWQRQANRGAATSVAERVPEPAAAVLLWTTLLQLGRRRPRSRCRPFLSR